MDDELEERVRNLERLLSKIAGIEATANCVLDIFLKKAHDLKKIDAKRDDVINLLCQKITELERRIDNANSRG